MAKTRRLNCVLRNNLVLACAVWLPKVPNSFSSTNVRVKAKGEMVVRPEGPPAILWGGGGTRGREPGRIGVGGVREAGEKSAGSGREKAKRYLLSFINVLEYLRNRKPI